MPFPPKKWQYNWLWGIALRGECQPNLAALGTWWNRQATQIDAGHFWICHAMPDAATVDASNRVQWVIHRDGAQASHMPDMRIQFVFTDELS
jgi:hypothetical protein